MERDALELEKVVRKEIENFPQNYRCHEGARMIARKLRSPAGMGVVVRDGGVVYETAYFLKCFEEFYRNEYYMSINISLSPKFQSSS